MIQLACLALVILAACSSLPAEKAKSGYAGTVQKVFRVVRQGPDAPGMRFLGNAGRVLGPVLRQNGETHQYIVRTPKGQIMAQSDEEFPVGECVQVIPQTGSSGPAFRYGEATIERSESCTG